MGRSTKELIDELQETMRQEAGGYVALVVVFDKHTEFVFAHEVDALKQLNGFVQRGGEPVGAIAISVETGGQEGKLKLRPLAEYENEEWVEKYLFTVAGQFKRLAASVSDSDGAG